MSYETARIFPLELSSATTSNDNDNDNEIYFILTLTILVNDVKYETEEKRVVNDMEITQNNNIMSMSQAIPMER